MSETLRFSDAMRALTPPDDAGDAAWRAAFAALAELALNRATLYAQGVAHRITEVEFYYRGPGHEDPFTHDDPAQERFGAWYFHRAGSGYRGGSYKGVDVALGGPRARGGMLVRGLATRAHGGALIDGPCRVVDHVLALAGATSIAALAARFDLSVDAPLEAPSPLWVAHCAEGDARAVYATPRVGLSLQRGGTEARNRFVARGYRFLTEPARTKKGRAHTVVGLHRAGLTTARIAALTGARERVVAGYIDAYERGRARSPGDFSGALSTRELCALFGACDARDSGARDAIAEVTALAAEGARGIAAPC